MSVSYIVYSRGLPPSETNGGYWRFGKQAKYPGGDYVGPNNYIMTSSYTLEKLRDMPHLAIEQHIDLEEWMQVGEGL